MSQTRKLLSATALPLVAGLGAAIALDAAGLGNPAAVSRPAQAQANPCAPANPCAAQNPCAARPAVAGAAANPYDVAAGHAQAPYGDKMPDVVENYLRAAPYVGTGGVVAPEGFADLARLGFKTIVNLNTAEEGAAQEGEMAKAAGLAYYNIPVGDLAPTAAQVKEFSRYVNETEHYPILVHCQSANRVGAMWALYRAANGVPPEIAVQEGRTVGLKPSREKAVREQLGLPPLPG